MDNDKKIVTKPNGDCGAHDCPFFDSFVESGWGIVWRCYKGPVTDIPGAEHNIPGYMQFCPHDPMAEILHQVSQMNEEDRGRFAEKIKKLPEKIQ